MSKVNVLDHGYVRLVDVMGSDLSVVNAARVSFDKESEWGIGEEIVDNYINEDGSVIFQSLPRTFLKNADKRLLRYLAEHGHSSPFRHATLSFEIYAPLMVMRQWGKYRVGSSWVFEDSDDPIETWNESSRRYVTEEPVFYIPDVWRSAPENKKQGSGEPISESWKQGKFSRWLAGDVTSALVAYKAALSNGVCAEQARLFLPAYAMYIRARWTVSLQGVIHFLQQRLKDDTQWETVQFAQAVRELAQPRFPESFEVFATHSGKK